MNLAATRDDLAAALLAAAVHGFFLVLLVIGVSWQIHDPQPIMAEIWEALPRVAKPLPPPLPEPEREPLPKLVEKPQPQPQVQPAPKAPAKAAPVDDKAAEIALEKKKLEEKKKEQEKKRQEALVEQKQELERQREEEKRRREEARLMELEAEREEARLETLKLKREQERQLVEQRRREALQREEEELERRMLEDSLALETRQAQARVARVAADKRAAEIAKIVDRYKAMISDKVRGNTRLPEDLAGNPEVVFEVSVLPTGEITKIRMLKSSGIRTYDQAVQTAIEKSSPLPLPSDRDAAAQFRLLELKHRPKA